MTRLVYSFLLYLLSPIIFLHLWLRGKKAPAYRKNWRERLGFYGQSQLTKRSLLIHCASVGEIIAATPFIKRIQSQYPTLKVTVTCNTPTGKQQIEQAFAQSVQCKYLPLDFPGAVSRMLNQLDPQLIVILETELWPNLLSLSNKRGIATIVINARLSQKSQRAYQRFAPITRLIMRNITHLAAHNAEDGRRFIELGLDRAKVSTTGSIKFDISPPSQFENKKEALAATLTKHSFIWVAGSTHPKEHELILQAHQQLLTQIPDALLIIAPRHPEQFDAVNSLLSDSSLSYSRRTVAPHNSQNCLLADTLGEMQVLFSLCNVAFIGGSLIERGGHNPLEAAVFAKPILSGPSYYNFMHVYPELIEAGACKLVSSSEQLSEILLQLAHDKPSSTKMGNQAVRVVKNNSGAINNSISIINEYLIEK